MNDIDDKYEANGEDGIKTTFLGNIVAIFIGLFIAYWIFEGSKIAIFLAVLLVGYVIYANLD